jgi:hypothetical protein
VGIALLFYLLLKHVNKGLSLLAAFFRLAQATVIGINLLNYFIPVLLVEKAGYLSTYSTEQLNALGLLFLNAHSYGYLISGVFFGISCLLLGYLIDCLVNFLFPEFAPSSEILVMTVAVVSELSLCLYLLIKGVKQSVV